MKILWDTKIWGILSFLSYSFQILKISYKNINKLFNSYTLFLKIKNSDLVNLKHVKFLYLK
jgi:hypothetical protein